MATKKARIKAEREREEKRKEFYRELQRCELSISRREKEWKKMLMKIAVPEMKSELEYAWISFERAMDNKDLEIMCLLQELNELEEQYAMNFQNHIEHIDRLIGIFQEQMNDLKKDFNDNISDLENSLEESIGGLSKQWREEEEFLRTLIYMLELSKKEQQFAIQTDYLNNIEEEETKNTQLIQRLRAFMEDTKLSIETETENIIVDYQERILKRKQRYIQLRSNDESLRKNLALKMEKIQEKHEAIKNLRDKFEDCQALLGRRIKDLENEHTFYNNAVAILKRHLDQDRILDERKIQTLSVSYNETIQDLEKIKQKGEHLLHVAEVCRKLETLEEKILPFPIGDSKEFAHTQNEEDHPDYIKTLDLFWQKVGQAEASRHALMEERDYLRRENDFLQKQIHEYCQCLSCPAPQSEMNRKLNWPPRDTKAAVNVTEGTLELKKYAKQNMCFSDNN